MKTVVPLFGNWGKQYIVNCFLIARHLGNDLLINCFLIGNCLVRLSGDTGVHFGCFTDCSFGALRS